MKISLLLLIAIGFSSKSWSIHNGTELPPDVFPQLVRVEVESTPQARWCSAMVVGPQSVLTAAHCCKDQKFEQVVTSDNQKFEIVFQKTHPRFSMKMNEGFPILSYPEGHIENDLCFIKVNGAFPFKPLTIASKKNLHELSDKTEVIGLGQGLPTLQVRQSARFVIELKTANGIQVIGKEKNTFMPGDSGGGIVALTPQGYVLAGIMSAANSKTCEFKSSLMKVLDPSHFVFAQKCDPSAKDLEPEGFVLRKAYSGSLVTVGSDSLTELLEESQKKVKVEICGFDMTCPRVKIKN